VIYNATTATAFEKRAGLSALLVCLFYSVGAAVIRDHRTDLQCDQIGRNHVKIRMNFKKMCFVKKYSIIIL
jgi:hypothetical protein